MNINEYRCKHPVLETQESTKLPAQGNFPQIVWKRKFPRLFKHTSSDHIYGTCYQILDPKLALA